MGTYLNHQVTFIFSEDESYWASELPDKSSGWYSDEDRSYTHDNYEGSTVDIKHGKAHPDYLASYGPVISKCGRVLQINTGCYGSYNLSSWTIPSSLIAIVSQWDNTQCGDCFVLKTIPAAEVPGFDWFAGSYKADFVGAFLEKLQPEGIDELGQWNQERWGIWSSMNEAAVMQHTPLDMELPLELIPLSKANIGPAKEVKPLYTPELVQKHDGVEGYTFVLTGKVTGLTREEATALLEQHGGTVVNSVTKEVDCVLAGEKSGSKVAKAKELGIEILNADDMFEELVNFKGNS